MAISSLNLAVKEVLQQGCLFLDRVGEEAYAGRFDGELAAPLGAHYRHVLDHFLCLAEGISTGCVDYDARRRNPQLETSVACARLATEELIDEFEELSSDDLRRDCAVTYSVGYGENGAEAVRSNLAREVMFCVGHAIHHYAILRLVCAGVGVKLPYEFGVAPSTLKHQRANIADRA